MHKALFVAAIASSACATPDSAPPPAIQDTESATPIVAPLADPDHRGTLTLVWENDIFAGNDGNYTNGAAIGWTSPKISTMSDGNFFSKMDRAFSFLPAIGDDGYDDYINVRLVQEIYTPPDITLPAPLPGDQPYAGVLFLETSMFAKAERSQHRYSLLVGVMGPSSLAAETQKKIHDWTGSDPPQGWDTQLDDEPIINAAYQYDYRLLRGAEPSEFGYDLTAAGGANLGNYLTSGHGSIVLRGGYDVPDTYGWADLQSGSMSGISVAPPARGWRLYASAGVTLTGIANFLPTDGNTFESSISGDRDDVYLAGSGAIIAAYKRFEIMFTINVLRGENRIPGAEHGDHGALSVSYFF